MVQKHTRPFAEFATFQTVDTNETKRFFLLVEGHMGIQVYAFTFRTGVKYEVFTISGEPYVIYTRFQALFNLKTTLRVLLSEFYSNDRGCVSGKELAVLKKYARRLHIRSGTPRITVFPLATVIELGKEMYPFLEEIGRQFKNEEGMLIEEDVAVEEEQEQDEEFEEPMVLRKRDRDDSEIKTYIDGKFKEMGNHFENVHKKWFSEEYAAELRSIAIENITIEEHKRVCDLQKELVSTQLELDKILAENLQLTERSKKFTAVARYLEMINSELH